MEEVYSTGIPIVVVIYVLPVLVAAWALIILHRIRSEHEKIRKTLGSIERLLQRNPPA